VADEASAEPPIEADEFLDESPFRSSLRSVLVVDLAVLSLWTAWSHAGPHGLSRLVLVIVWSLPAVWNLATRQTLRRLALRRIRRGGRASLFIVVCVAIVTSLLTLSTALSDSVSTSARTAVDNQFGAIDEMILAPSPELRVAAQSRLDQTLAKRSDTVNDLSLLVRGQVGFVVSDAVLRNGRAPERLVERSVHILEMNVTTASQFGTSATATGLAGVKAPDSGHLLLGPYAAASLGVRAGETVTMVDRVGGDRQFVVDRVLPKRGFGVLPLDGSDASEVAIVPIGTMTTMASPPPLTYVIAITNRNGSKSSDAVTERLETSFRSVDGNQTGDGKPGPSIDVTVDNVKAQILQQAAARTLPVSRLLKTLSLLFGVGAGLLLVTLFYGLAVARTAEVGALRSVGLRRRDAIAAFGIEGWCYSFAGALSGALLGLGATVLALHQGGAPPGIVTVQGGPHLRALWIGLACGSVLSSAALAVSMLLTTRGTIQRASGAAGESSQRSPLSRGGEFTVFAVAVVGGMLILRSLDSRGSFSFLGGLLLFVSSVAALLRNRRHGKAPLIADDSRLRIIGPGIAVVVAIALPYVLPRWFRHTGIGTQVLYAFGLLVPTSLLAREFAPWLVLPQRTETHEGRRRAARTLVKASPLVAPNRDALLRAAVASLVMALTAIGFVQPGFADELSTRVRAARGGWQTFVETADPADLPELVRAIGTAGVTSAVSSFNVEVGDSSGHLVRVGALRVGTDYTKRSPLVLTRRAQGLSSDVAAFESLTKTAGTVIVDQNLFVDGGTRLQRVSIDDTLYVRDLRTGRTQSLTVIGVARSTTGLGGIVIGPATGESLRGDLALTSNRFLLATADPTAGDGALVKQALAKPGVTSEPIDRAARSGMFAALSVVQSLRWLMWLGGLLVLGAVSVLMVRMVAGRRSEWAVLRSLGMSAEAIRRVAASECLQLLGPAVLGGAVVGYAAARLLVWAGSFGVGGSLPFSTLVFAGAMAVVIVPVLAAVRFLKFSLAHDAPMQRDQGSPVRMTSRS
jgi:ABC-type lipoprotein release transport system permease subunit